MSRIQVQIIRSLDQFRAKDKNPYYVYAHYRLKDHECFYIGRGKGRRAIATHGRNKLWQNISRMGYVIKILYDNLTLEESIAIEKQLIGEIGRKENGGPLANFTDGGEGLCGYRATAETLAKKSKAIKGKGLVHVDEQELARDYLAGNTLRQLSRKYGICIGTILKIIPNETRKIAVAQNRKLYAKNNFFSQPFVPSIGLYSGKNNPFYGRKHTEETKRIMSLKKLRHAKDTIQCDTIVQKAV